MPHDYDLFVIGAGSGGVRAARMSAQLGARVGIAEGSRVGGTCVIRGCVPKKFMVYASEFGHLIEDAKGYGWTTGERRFDWPTLRDAIAGELDRLEGIYQGILKRNDVDLIEAYASLAGPNEVRLASGRTVTAERILLAVGGQPTRDERIEGHELGLVSDDLFDLPRLPRSMVIAGGGYIAIEFAHVFAGLGVDVTLVYRGERLLRAFDEEVSERVEANLRGHGVTYVNQTVFTRIEGEAGGPKRVHLKDGQVIEADEAVWAIGRRPSTDGLGLEAAGIKTDEGGAIPVDAHSRTRCPSVWAIGDVTNRINLTPVAIREGAAFARTEFGGVPTMMDYRFVPKAVFAQPPVGSVGYTEAELEEAGRACDVYETDFRPMRNVLADNPERYLIKLLVERETDMVLGCHMVGHEAPEVIQAVAVAVKAGITKAQLDATCALHPTASEELVTLTAKRDG